MRVNIIGIENVSYINKDGIQIQGKRINYTYPMSTEMGEGLRIGSDYIGNQKIHTPFKLGEYELYFAKSAKGSAYIDGYQEV